MKWKIEKPKSDKDGLSNSLKMIANNLENGNIAEAKFGLSDLIDSVSPDRVRFEWMSTGARARSKKAITAGIARYAMENPSMVD